MKSTKHTKSGYDIRTQEKRKRVKETAFNILEQNGNGQLNMDILAEKSGVAKMSIYNYFGNKLGLLSEIIIELLEADYNKIVKILESEKNCKEKLTLYLKLKHNFACNGYLAVLKHTVENNETVAERLEDYKKKTIAAVTKTIKQGEKEGAIDGSIDREVIFRWIHVMIIALEQDEVLRKRIENNPKFFDKFIDIFFRGLQNKSK